MKFQKILLISAFIILTAKSQVVTTALPFLTIPRGVASYGLADQGVAFNAGLSGLQYNPATLALLCNITVETGKLDQFVFLPSYPLSWYRVGMNLEGIGVFGIEYTYFDLGEYGSTSLDPTVLSTFKGYELAFAISYAREMSKDFSLGGTIRYAYSRLGSFGATHGPRDAAAHGFLLSAGMFYHVTEWADRFTLGFSLTDFGAPVHYIDEQQRDPVPAFMRFGVSIAPIGSENQRLTLMAEGSRVIADHNDDYSGKSSFSALFSTLRRFPHDITGHAAAMYEFPRLPLIGDLSINSRIIFGVFDEPPAYGLNTMTASVDFGAAFRDFLVRFSVGSVWHHIEPIGINYFGFPKTIPEESIGMTIEYSPNHSSESLLPEMKKTTVVAGVGSVKSIGRLKEDIAGNGTGFSVECAAYTSDATAIVTSFTYQSNNVVDILQKLDPDGRWRFWSASMMYRYDLNNCEIPFYVQGGPAFFRMSYSTPSTSITMIPSYRYFGGVEIGAGAPIKLSPIIVVPFVDFTSMLIGQFSGPAPRLAGYNQWSFGIKAGLEL